MSYVVLQIALGNLSQTFISLGHGAHGPQGAGEFPGERPAALPTVRFPYPKVGERKRGKKTEENKNKDTHTHTEGMAPPLR